MRLSLRELSRSRSDSVRKLIQSIACAFAVLTTPGCAGAEPGGAWITFVSHRTGRNLLYKMQPDGSGLSVLFGGELKGVPGLSEGLVLYREPHWARLSPDRRFFLDWAGDVGLPLEKYESAQHFMIYLGRLDGGPVRVLASDGDEDFAWSPDSRRLAYGNSSVKQPNLVSAVTSRVPSAQIFVVGIDGSHEQIVLEKPGLWNVLDWSRDGSKLLLNYTSASSLAYASSSLFEFDLAAAQQVMKESSKKDYTFSLFYPGSHQIDTHLKLLTGSVQAVDGRYSPDGKTVALMFERERNPYGTRFELGVLDLADLKLRPVPVPSAPGLRGPICWSPDGREILFSRWLDPKDDKEKMEGEHGLGIYAIQPDGSHLRFLTTGWSPDWR